MKMMSVDAKTIEQLTYTVASLRSDQVPSLQIVHTILRELGLSSGEQMVVHNWEPIGKAPTDGSPLLVKLDGMDTRMKTDFGIANLHARGEAVSYINGILAFEMPEPLAFIRLSDIPYEGADKHGG